ncbi:MAG: hypothetical protein GXO64_03030 [Candidatus Micrarchaeota archaeon]|nr:hypothetical protein [Candidatus Micrarchaeota archaeon]
MKIAITSGTDSIEGNVDQRFGRCKYFIVVDVENGEIRKWEAIENIGASQSHGAGTQAAQQIGNAGPEVLITGNLGPNAANILGQLPLRIYQASGSIRDALRDFSSGKLKPITGETAPAHATENVSSGNEKILFPLLDNNGMGSHISEHFGHAPFFGIYDTKTKELKIIPNALDHSNPEKSPVDQILETERLFTVFAKGIGSRALKLFREKGVNLKTGRFETVGDAVGNLSAMEDLTEDCGD